MRFIKQHWGKLLFLTYCIWMLWLLYGQRLGFSHAESFSQYLEQSVNLRPFRTIGNYWHVAFRTSDAGLLRHIVINLAGNVIMFIPLGFFLPLNWKVFRKLPRLILAVLGIILCIELLQMVTMLGSLDVDDVLLNMLGCSMGYYLWKIMYR